MSVMRMVATQHLLRHHGGQRMSPVGLLDCHKMPAKAVDFDAAYRQ